MRPSPHVRRRSLSGRVAAQTSLAVIEAPTVKDRNRTIVSLTLAMVGAVSSNFRMVALERLEDRWHVHYWLETECEEDREEIATSILNLLTLWTTRRRPSRSQYVAPICSSCLRQRRACWRYFVGGSAKTEPAFEDLDAASGSAAPKVATSRQ